MSEAPERIFAHLEGDDEGGMFSHERPTDPHPIACPCVEYVRADLIPDYGATHSELIKNLRDGNLREGGVAGGIELFDIDAGNETMHEAADEIERLTAENAKLREALGNVAERDTLSGHCGELDWLIEEARAALTPTSDGD